MEVADITNVETAAKFLDEKLPGWEKKITRPIVLADTSSCILGQNGGYYKLSNRFFPHGDPREHPADGYSYSLFSNNKYNYAWQQEVNKRIQKPIEKPVGNFEWAIEQLANGRDVECNGNVWLSKNFTDVNTAQEKHYFALDMIRAKNWKLKNTMFGDLRNGDKFNLVGDKAHAVFTKCSDLYYMDVHLNIYQAGYQTATVKI